MPQRPELMPQSRVERTVRDHDKGVFSLFLGAGASKSSGVPLASEMIREWRCQAFRENHGDADAKDDAALEAWCATQAWYQSDQEYSLLFETLYDRPLRQKYIERHIKDAVPSWGYLYLANIVRHGFFNITYTTNFDDLINEGLTVYLGYNPVVCAADSVVESINPATERAKIIKLHGDYLFEHLKNTREELARLDPNMEKKFRLFSRDRGLVVLGYAGRDESVMSVIEALLAEPDRHFPTGVFWGVRETEDPAPRVLALHERYADRFHLFRCDDFDVFMARLHDQLQLALPDSIREPYETLRRKLEALTGIQDAVGAQDRIISEHRKLLEEQLARPWATAEGSPMLLLLEAQLLLAHRQHGEAIRKLEEYDRQRPDDPDALNAWGGALAMESEDTGNSEAMRAAIEKWKRSAELDPQATPARRSLAAYYAIANQTEEAIKYSEELLKLSPRDKMLSMNLAYLYLRGHRHLDALRLADRMLESDRDDPALHAFRSDLLATIGRLEEAIEQGARAVELDPDNAWFRAGYGQLLFQGGRLEEAEREFLRAMELDPKNPTPLLRLCVLLAGTFRTGEMQTRLTELRELSPALADSLQAQFDRQPGLQVKAGLKRLGELWKNRTQGT